MQVFWLDGFLYCVVQWLYPSPKPTVFNDGHRALGELLLSPCGYTTWISSSTVNELGNPLSMQPSEPLLLETFLSLSFFTWDGVSLPTPRQYKSL